MPRLPAIVISLLLFFFFVSPATAQTLTVGSFNTSPTWAGFEADVAEFIIDHQIEVISIQESPQQEYQNLRTALNNRGWSMNGQYWDAGLGPGDTYRAVLSKYPMLEYQVITNVSPPRPLQTFVIQHPFGRIRFVNIHPPPGNSCPHHERYLADILARFPTDPMILLGDFNMNSTEHASCYQAYLAQFDEACTVGRNASCADSVNDIVFSGSTGPNSTIDHIFLQKNSLQKGLSTVWRTKNAFIANQIFYPGIPQTQQAYVLEKRITSSKTGASYTPFFSDHFPLVATIEFVPPSPTPTPSPTARPAPPTATPVNFPNTTMEHHLLPLGQSDGGQTCDICGFCIGSSEPAAYDECVACMYDMTSSPAARTDKTWTIIGCVKDSPAGMTTAALSVTMGVIGGIAFLRFLYGCYLIITAGTQPETYEQGKSIITSSLLGLGVVVFAIFLLRTVGVTILQIPGFQ